MAYGGGGGGGGRGGGGSGGGDGDRAGGGQRRLSATQSGGGAMSGDDSGDILKEWGLVTNIHLSDLAIEGTLESMKDVLCPFVHLRELDLDGGRLRGKGPPPQLISLT